MAKNPHPSLLSFTASIDPSIFPMFAKPEDGEPIPLAVGITTVKGTIANHTNEDLDQALEKAEKSPNNPNIQKIEIAHLPSDMETLVLKGSIKFLPNSLGPNACNDPEFTEYFVPFIQAYRKKGGFRYLAERYFMNVINGRILWRNRYGKDVKFRLRMEEDENRTAIDHTFLLDNVKGRYPLSLEAIQDNQSKNEGAKIVEEITKTISGENGEFDCLQIEIEAESTMGKGQDVYPSQEFSEKRANASGEVSKVLAKIDWGNKRNQAIMHSQKIGNAIRTIDDWYENASEAIAVEPYGVNQAMQRALRRNDHLYKYITTLSKLTADIENGKVPPQAHFVAACCVRGGVFSRAK